MKGPIPDRVSGTMRLRRFSALLRKESLQIIRDPSSILIAFVLPVVLLVLFGYGVSLDTARARIAIVDEAPTPITRDLAFAFQASSFFEVVQGFDRRDFEQDLVLGRIKGIVVIPAGFSARRATASYTPIQVIVDGSEPNTASFVHGYVQGAVSTWTALETADVAGPRPPITVEQHVWFNAQLTSRNFLVPGSIAIVMTLVGTLLTSLVVAREWERGTMESIMATPAGSGELLLSKVIPYFVLALASMTLCVGLAVLVFGVPFRGSIMALYALCAAFLVPALGQGLVISAATRNQFLASQLALISAFLPAFLLSGFLFEINSMPQSIQWITALVPARYLIPGLQSVFLAGDIWPMFLRSIAIMLGIGAALFALAVRNTRKRID